MNYHNVNMIAPSFYWLNVLQFDFLIKILNDFFDFIVIFYCCLAIEKLYKPQKIAYRKTVTRRYRITIRSF